LIESVDACAPAVPREWCVRHIIPRRNDQHRRLLGTGDEGEKEHQRQDHRDPALESIVFDFGFHDDGH
jgi:hypothetical protein